AGLFLYRLQPALDIGLAVYARKAKGFGRSRDFRIKVGRADDLPFTVQLLLQDFAIDLAVEHLAAVPRDALLGKLGEHDRFAIDGRGHAGHLLLLLRIVDENLYLPLGLVLQFFKAITRGLPELVLLEFFLNSLLL